MAQVMVPRLKPQQQQAGVAGTSTPTTRPLPANNAAAPARQVAPPVTAQRPKQPATTWRQENQNLRKSLATVAPGTPEYDRKIARINFNRQKAGLKPAKDLVVKNPEAPAAAPVEAPITDPTPEVPGQPNTDFMKIMFPDVSTDKFGAVEDTDFYKFREAKAQNELDKRLAAQGLTNSGKQIRDAMGLNIGLSGEEAQRQDASRQAQIDRELQRGGNFQQFLTGEADRRDLQSRDQFDRMYKILGLSMDQNPMKYGYEATQYGADLNYNYGKNAAASAANAYARVPSSGGGGGSTPFRAPFPSQPDMTMANASSIFGNAATNNDWASAFSSLFS